ncbi:hypothetical protein BGZ60DRAFT_346927, partial [Tricladium varicosporioides]
VSFPPTGTKRSLVEKQDIDRLDEGEFLNDSIVNFYLRWLEHNLEQTNPDISRRIYFHNSFFYEALTKTPRGKRGINYESVKRWTSKVDLFEKDYIIVPVCENLHWYLAIICNAPRLLAPEANAEKIAYRASIGRKYDLNGPRILTLDSFGHTHSPTCINLKDYLVAELKTKHQKDIPPPGSLGLTVKHIPTQPNFYDCGVFLLMYVEKFL